MSIGSNATVHSVHFYDQNEAMIERLRGIVASGLEIGNSVLVVATAEHRLQLLQALSKSHVRVRGAEKAGRFVLCDAEEMLSSFMVGDKPDPDKFVSTLGRLLTEVKEAAVDAGKGVTVFGEMVAVLWQAGNKTGALKLEELWNDLLNGRTFHLHCAYPTWQFSGSDRQDIEAVCDHHSHVIGNTRSVKPFAMQ
jgi:hypothetical protein